MKNVIIYTNEIGGVSVCIPTGKLPIEQVQSKDVPVGLDSYIVRADTLPESDGDFFNAWEQVNGIVTVNMQKAKEIKRDIIRVDRNARLAQLDIDFMKAVEQGDLVKQQEVAAEKQRLRDITRHPSIDACTTPEELKVLELI